MPRSWTHRLEDILDAFAAIDEYVSACTLSEFASDRRTIQAVAFNFVVIGEAAGQVPDEVRARAAHIP